MPNAPARANARALPEATTRRAALGAILAAGAIALVPISTVAGEPGGRPSAAVLLARALESEKAELLQKLERDSEKAQVLKELTACATLLVRLLEMRPEAAS